MAQTNGEVTDVVKEQQDDRGILDQVLDTGKEYIEQGKEFVTDIYNNFSKLDSTDTYKIEGDDLYSKEIRKEADKTTLDRSLDAVGKFIDTAIVNPIQSMYNAEDSFMKKFTGTEIFRNERDASTANQAIIDFYKRDDVLSEKDQNKQYALQQELFNKIRPFIKPEKAMSDDDIQKAIDELSIIKQQEKYQKEIEDDKLRGIIDKEIKETVDKRYTKGTNFYNQGLLDNYRKGATQELNEVMETKKDLQISSLEMGIDREEVENRIAKLDKIISIKKKQIDAGLKSAYMDNDAFEEDGTTGRLKIYNKALELLSDDEVKTLLDYERNNTQDINTLLNVNRFNQLKKGGILDRLGAGVSGAQGALGLTLDAVNTAVGAKTILGGLVGRNYTEDNRESMLDALKSDENYLALANKTGFAYFLKSTLNNFDDVGEAIIGPSIANKALRINKVANFLDGVTGPVKGAIATGAKGIVEGYAYNNGMSVASNEIASDDYQMANAIIDPFAENILAFLGHMGSTSVSKLGLNYFDLTSARQFKKFMEEQDPNYKNRDIEDVKDDLNAGLVLIKTNIDKSKNKELLKNPTTIADTVLKISKEIEETGSYNYKPQDGLMVTKYQKNIESASSPAYIFNNAGNIINNTNQKYLGDILRSYINEPSKVINTIKDNEVKTTVSNSINIIKNNLSQLDSGNIDEIKRGELINSISQEGMKINSNIRKTEGNVGDSIELFDLDNGKVIQASLTKEGGIVRPNISGVKYVYNKSKFIDDDYVVVKDLVNGLYKAPDNYTSIDDIRKDIAFKIGLEEKDIALDGENNFNAILKLTKNDSGIDKRFKLVQNTKDIDVNKIKLVQKGMSRVDIIGLLLNDKDYTKTIKTFNDAEETLNSLLPVIGKHILTNNVDLRNFKEASRLAISSNSLLKVFSDLGVDGSEYQMFLLKAASIFSEKKKLVGDVMRLQDDTMGNVTKAELIGNIFSGIVKPELEKDYSIITKHIGAEYSNLFTMSNKSFEKIEKLFDDISKLNKVNGESLRTNYRNINLHIKEKLLTESLTEDVLKAMNSKYTNIVGSIAEQKVRYKDFIYKQTELFNINNKPTNISGLLRTLKGKLKEETNKESIVKLEEAISKIEKTQSIALSYNRQLKDLANRILLIDTSDANKANATRQFIEIKSELYDIRNNIGEVYDESIEAGLKEVMNAYINKKTSTKTYENVIQSFNDISEQLVNIKSRSESYTGYINQNGEIVNFLDMPRNNAFKSILSFNDSSIRSYTKFEEEIKQVIKEEFNTDIDDIKYNSITEGEFNSKLLDTEFGKKMLFPSTSINIENLSFSNIMKEINSTPDMLKKIDIIDNKLYNIKKYFISIGKDTKDLGRDFDIIRAKYILEATKGFINTVNDLEKPKLKELIYNIIKGEKSFTETLVNAGFNLMSFDIKNAKDDFIGELENLLLGNNSNDFYKAQMNVNKYLLEGTPLALFLQNLGINYSTILTDISKINVNGKNLEGISKEGLINIIKTITSFRFKGKEEIKELNLDKEEFETFINKQIEGNEKPIIEIYKAIEPKINNYILDLILSITPNSLKQKKIVNIKDITNLIDDETKEIFSGLEKMPYIGDIIKNNKEGFNNFKEEIIRIANSPDKSNEIITKVDVESQNKFINEMINRTNKLLNNDTKLENGKTELEIIEENDKELRNYLYNYLRNRSSLTERKNFSFNGMYGKRTSEILDNSDGINSIMSMKYQIGFSNSSKPIFDKYDDIFTAEFEQGFYNSIKQNYNMTNADAKKLYVYINNAKYIEKKLGIKITSENIDFEFIGLENYKNLYNNVYDSVNGENFLAFPTWGEEANKGIFINPSEDLIINKYKDKVQKSGGTNRLKKGETLNDIILDLDETIFQDVKNVMGINPDNKQDFAKRLKGYIAGGDGLLRDNEEIFSFQLDDDLVIRYYGLFESFKDINGTEFNDKEQKRIIDFLKGKGNLTDKEFNEVLKLLSSEGYSQEKIPEIVYGFDKLIKTSGILELQDEVLNRVGDTTVNILGANIKVKPKISEIFKNLKYDNKDNLLKEISLAKTNKDLNKLDKELKDFILSKLDEAYKIVNSTKEKKVIQEAAYGKDLSETLSKDKDLQIKGFIYLLSKKSDKVKGSIERGLKNGNAETFSNIINDRADAFDSVATLLTKESTDGMGYMSRDLAIALYEERAFKKFEGNDNELPDLKAHIIGDGVFEKSRQATLDKETDNEFRRIIKDTVPGFKEDSKFIMSFRSAVKANKDDGYKKINKDVKLNIHGADIGIRSYRKINTNNIKVAASDAVQDKSKVVISNQYLSSTDSVIFKGIQNLAIEKQVAKITTEGNKFKTGKVLADNRGIHNLESLDETIRQYEQDLFGLTQGVTTDGAMLKLSGESKYKRKDGKYEDLELNTLYISEYKYNKLKESGQLKSIGKDSEGEERFVAIAFRNPVPSPYNASVLQVKIDYSLQGKNSKIHPEDTFLKKEGDFDADTITLSLPGDNDTIYKALLLSALEQTTTDFKHDITFEQANGDSNVFVKKVEEQYNLAIKNLNDKFNEGSFNNKYIPTEQIDGAVKPGMEKPKYATETMFGALIESAIAKENIGVVSVSQEWIYDTITSLKEYDKGNELLGDELIGEISIREAYNMLDITDRDVFFPKFASILQTTLDYAKSKSKFPDDWLRQELKPLMKDLGDIDINRNIDILERNINLYAKNIKDFKNMEVKTFKEEEIQNLPPSLRDRYYKIRKSMDSVSDLKMSEEERTQAYIGFFNKYLGSNLDEKTKLDLQGRVQDILYRKEYASRDEKSLLLNEIVNVKNNKGTLSTLFDDFNFKIDLEDTNKSVEKTITYDKNSDQYKALNHMMSIGKEGTNNLNVFKSKYFNIVKSNDRISFTYDKNNFNNTQLITKYGDVLYKSKEGIDIKEAIGFYILGYNKVSGLNTIGTKVDELKKIDESLVNSKLLTYSTTKERKAFLEANIQSDSKDKLISSMEKNIEDMFDNTDEYNFYKDLTGYKSLSELKNSGYELELKKSDGNYELLLNKINKGLIDEVINEIELKGNVSNSLRYIYQNIDGYAKTKTSISSLKIDENGNIINTLKYIDGESKGNTFNVVKEFMNDELYRDQIMKKTYEIDPSNAVSVIEDLEKAFKVLNDGNSWNIYSKLVKYAPELAERFTHRDKIKGLGMSNMLDNILKLKTKNLDDGWKKKIDNSIFIQAARGVVEPRKLEIIKVKGDSLLDDIKVNDLKKYQDDLINITFGGKGDKYHGGLTKMIEAINYNTDKLSKDNVNSYLISFLEMDRGQHERVLNEAGIGNNIEDFKLYIKNKNPDISESELDKLSKEVMLQSNNSKIWKILRAVKSNMFMLAFAPIIVPAALSVTILQMLPDFFINIAKKSKSFNDPRVNALLRRYNVLDAETIRHIKNINDTMNTGYLQQAVKGPFDFLRSFISNPTLKEYVSNIELILTNGFAVNDIILGPLRRQVAATRAFDTIAKQVGGVDEFFARFGGDEKSMDKAMGYVRMQSQMNFIDLSGGSSTARLAQTNIFSSGVHNLWNFMQSWSTSMVNQHVVAAYNMSSCIRHLINGNRKEALQKFGQVNEYLGGQLKMGVAIGAALAKYQIVFNENRGEDGEYDYITYLKTLNNTIAGLESWSPYGAVTGILDRYDTNQGLVYNLALASQEITGRFGREFNLPKNMVAYLTNATKMGVEPDKILDGMYDILNDRTNGFIKYNKFDVQDGYYQDSYTTNLFGIATGVGDLNSYQNFKENIKKYGSQRAFEELSTQGKLAILFGSSNYIKMISSAYGEEGSFKIQEQVFKDILDIRDKDLVLRKLISTGMDKEVLDEIMITNGKLDAKQIDNVFFDMTSYSARGMSDFIQNETGLTGFQWDDNSKHVNIIDNLVVSKLNEKYGKDIVDAIAQNDYLKISDYIKKKIGPEMLSSLQPTGSSDPDEAKLRKMLLIASEKSELSIPTLVSTMIYDKSYQLQKKGYNEQQAKYLAIQIYGPLANGNMGMKNDVANAYTIKKYNDKLKPLFNPKFKEAFSNTLENKLLIDMAVGRAMYEEGDTGAAELRGDMTSIFNNVYKNMKEKNNGVLSKEDSIKLMTDYAYIDTQLNKLNGKVDPMKLFNYREGVMMSLLNKPDLLAEVEADDGFNKTWGSVKDNLAHRFLKFEGEKSNYQLDSFEELVKDKYNAKIGLKSGSYRSGSYGSSFGKSSSGFKPKTSGNYGGGQGGGQGRPMLERALNSGFNPTRNPPDIFKSNPYSFVSPMGGPKQYYDDLKTEFNTLHKQMYEQFSKDIIKTNPEYINRLYSIKKQYAEGIGMKSKLIRSDYDRIPRIPFSKLSKGLIPGWAYRREI